MNKKNGFTLAEVLITLGIIGVVAAMTIPTLINKTNKAEFVTALKKSYSVLSQAHEQIIKDNDDLKFALSGVLDSKGFADIFTSKISVSKNCGTDAIPNACMAKPKYLSGGDTDIVNDFEAGINASSMSSFLSNDGMSYGFMLSGNGDKNCEYDASTLYGMENGVTPSPLKEVCGAVIVDVNGSGKGPTTLGRDWFVFWIARQGIYPLGMGADDASINSECSTTGNGGLCAERVLKENAINY